MVSVTSAVSAAEDTTKGSPVPLPAGFTCAGCACGLKKSGANDLGIIICEQGAAAAGVFTTNLVAAAPVQVSRRHLRANHGHANALLVNSGCANAATGPQGLANCESVVDSLAALLGVDREAVLVNSTGVIGVQLDSARIEAALESLVASASAADATTFARAIMTTDTRLKVVRRAVAGSSATVVGVAKGAGMIHPNMATMIAVLMTDAEIEPPQLDSALRHAVEGSFHRISVDGDTSTNDSVFALASGQAGAASLAELQAAFDSAARDLALMVVQDGEGFERGIEVQVTRASTAANALQLARTVAMSLLVRTAVTGGDPNWGRILAAAGRAGVAFDPDRINISANGVRLFGAGQPAQSTLEQRREAFNQSVVRIEIDLAQGTARDHFFSCGLTKRYVEINADYTT